MSSAKNSSKVSVSLKGWTDKGYSIISLHLVEEIGGSLAHGILELMLPKTDDTLENITKENHGTLIIQDSKKNGREYQIPIFIEKREYLKNTMTLNFVCIGDENFFTRLNSLSFDSIRDALDTLYNDKDRTFIDVSSDMTNNVPIYQNRETNYNLLKKLALGYKENCVYGFGWEGFILKDLKKEPESEIAGGTNTFSTDTYNLTYNKLINNQPYNPWEEYSELDDTCSSGYSDVQAKYCRVSVDYDNYTIFGVDYINLHKNTEINKQLLESSMRSNITISRFDLPKEYSLGSIVKYKVTDEDQEKPFNKFVIAGNELFYSQNGASYYSPHGFRFEFITKLYGIDEGDWSK